METPEDPPFTVLRLPDAPRTSFPLRLSAGRELLGRVAEVEDDPPALLARRIQAAAEVPADYVIQPDDEPVLLAALEASPPLAAEVLLALRDALRDKRA